MATRRGKDNFRFTTVELGALAMSFTVTSALVFVLGFYVGRRVSAEHAPVAQNVARIPVGAPPAEAAAPRPAARSRGDAEASVLAPTHKSTATAPAQGVPAPKLPVATVPALTPPGDLAAAHDAPPATLPGMPRTAPPGVPFTVQVLATRNRIEADTLAADLKRRGFGAYVAAVDDAGGSWYRVRIGHYEDAEAARRTAERASRELGLTQAYVSPIYSEAR